MIKRTFTKAIGVLLCLALCLSLLSCGNKFTAQEGDYTRIHGENLYFVTKEEALAWKKPLSELLNQAFLAWEEASKSEWDVMSKNPAAIATSYACGLLDVTADGMPELLVHPLGHFGSSGTVTYYIYDIASGAYLGYLDGGNDESFCAYYDLSSERTVLIGQYWLRFGWDARSQYIQMLGYDPENSEYRSQSFLESSHQIVMKHSQMTDENGNVIDVYDESHCESTYYLRGDQIPLEEYDAEHRLFLKNYIPIPETALQCVRWDEISDDMDSDAVKIEKMTEALLCTEQKFLKPAP